MNDLVKLDNYVLPRILKLISKFSKQQWFTSIDLKNGFFQMTIRKQDKKITAFSTKLRHMQFKWMP